MLRIATCILCGILLHSGTIEVNGAQMHQLEWEADDDGSSSKIAEALSKQYGSDGTSAACPVCSATYVCR